MMLSNSTGAHLRAYCAALFQSLVLFYFLDLVLSIWISCDKGSYPFSARFSGDLSEAPSFILDQRGRLPWSLISAISHCRRTILR